jgi:hypothetical protein
MSCKFLSAVTIVEESPSTSAENVRPAHRHAIEALRSANRKTTGFEPQSAGRIISEARAMVWEWNKLCGPVADLPQAFMVGHEVAERNGRMEQFVENWQTHLKVGKAIAKDLSDFVAAPFPDDVGVIRDLVRQAFDLNSTIQAGVAMIEAHLNAFT